MIDFAQSNLAALIAAAVITSALLGVAASESAQRQDIELQRAIDAIAFAIAASGCSANRPEARIPIAGVLGSAGDRIASLTLMPDHLRAVRSDAGVLTSVQFPPLHLLEPLEISKARALSLGYDSMDERCTASLLTA